MARTLLFHLQDGKMRFLEAAVESWKQDHEEAMRALDAEDLVAEGLSSWEDVRRLWNRTRSLASRNALEDIQESGAALLDLLNRSVRLLGNLAELADLVTSSTGHTIEGREKLPEAIRGATGLRDHVANTWPWDDRPAAIPSLEMIEAARARRERGERGIAVTEILAGLRQDAHP